MKRISRLFLSVITVFACLAVSESFAQNMSGAVPGTSSAQGTNQVVQNTAIIPAWRTYPTNWVTRHEGFVRAAQKGGVDILFLGDSITEGWRDRGLTVWNKYYAPRHAANFGIGGDRTEHILWRMDHGELDGINPKVIVLLIGTNNTGKDSETRKPNNTNPEIIAGVRAVVGELRAKLPDSKILLLAIFPRETLDDPQRAQVALINTVLAKLDNGKMVKYLDIGSKFLEADGTLPRKIMPDLLHPSQQGYQIWAESMEPTLDEMLK
jgi:lysophospholipase L1-like esterase